MEGWFARSVAQDLEVNEDDTVRTIAGASGQPNVRILSVDGKEIHRCELPGAERAVTSRRVESVQRVEARAPDRWAAKDARRRTSAECCAHGRPVPVMRRAAQAPRRRRDRDRLRVATSVSRAASRTGTSRFSFLSPTD